MTRFFAAVRDRFTAYQARATERGSLVLLAGVSFVDSFLIFVPPEVLLGAMAYGRLGKAWLYTLVASAASALGGAVTYAVGALAYDTLGLPLMRLFGAEAAVATLSVQAAAAPFAVLVALGISPIPKIPLLIAAGALGMSLPIVLFSLFLARLVRYGAVAYAVAYFGERALPALSRLAGSAGYLALGALVLLFVLIGFSAYAILPELYWAG